MGNVVRDRRGGFGARNFDETVSARHGEDVEGNGVRGVQVEEGRSFIGGEEFEGRARRRSFRDSSIRRGGEDQRCGRGLEVGELPEGRGSILMI